jgi:UDP-2-acetamido-3-amino-2,3-dideoxy-glucuronate N-acetyltransferase
VAASKSASPRHYQHPLALVETDRIGAGTRVWAYAHVMNGAHIGRDCNIGDHAFVEAGARIGNGVTIKNGVAIWEGVTLHDFVFAGPNAVFTNDLRPRSPRFPGGKLRYTSKSWLSKTNVKRGASIGANATVVCGVTIGEFAMIGAGAVVTKNVPAHALWLGVPGKLAGYVCECGERLAFKEDKARCNACRTRFIKRGSRVKKAV